MFFWDENGERLINLSLALRIRIMPNPDNGLHTVTAVFEHAGKPEYIGLSAHEKRDDAQSWLEQLKVQIEQRGALINGAFTPAERR